MYVYPYNHPIATPAFSGTFVTFFDHTLIQR